MDRLGYAIRKKIISSSRNYRLDIPKLIMKGMGWSADEVEVIPNPDENIIILRNPSKNAIGSFGFLSNINDAKWEKNKKAYTKNLSEGLSPDGRMVLHSTNWNEVEDGGYWVIRQGFDFIKELDNLIKKGPKGLRDVHRSMKHTHIWYLQEVLKYLEGKKAKKPRWFWEYEKKLISEKEKEERLEKAKKASKNVKIPSKLVRESTLDDNV